MAVPQPEYTPEMLQAFRAFLAYYGKDNVPSGSSQNLLTSRPHENNQPPKRKFFAHAITSAISDLPIAVIRELTNGFKNYIPLTMCTHKAQTLCDLLMVLIWR